MHVAELWRYPVKSMRGESLAGVEVRKDGLVGDRLVQVVDDQGELVTARRRPRLLGIEATHSGGKTLVAGVGWEEADIGHRHRLVSGAKRFDESPLLVATDGAADAFGADRRRFRPNVVIGGVEGYAERDWPEGGILRAGEVEIRLGHLCERCVVTTLDPDTIDQDADVLRRLNDELDSLFAWNCWVQKPGRVAVGDPVELV